MTKAKQRSPARAALADAIQARADAVRKVDQMKQARDRGLGIVEAARQRLDDARSAIVTLREERAAAISFVATTGATMPTDTKLRDARLEEANAIDELEAAECALAGLDAKLVFESSEIYPRNTTDPVRLAGFAVEDSVKAVIRAEFDVARMVREAKEALEIAGRKHMAIVLLVQNGTIEREHWKFLIENVRPCGVHGFSPRSHNSSNDPVIEVQHPNLGNAGAEIARKDWAAAFDLLQTNPDAELPA